MKEKSTVLRDAIVTAVVAIVIAGVWFIGGYLTGIRTNKWRARALAAEVTAQMEISDAIKTTFGKEVYDQAVKLTKLALLQAAYDKGREEAITLIYEQLAERDDVYLGPVTITGGSPEGETYIHLEDSLFISIKDFPMVDLSGDAQYITIMGGTFMGSCGSALEALGGWDKVIEGDKIPLPLDGTHYDQSKNFKKPS
jgi:hypothetical protein